ncbi:tail assembly protein [Geothrix sp. PMB-07]|uniref:tail assembly protein n=1 Tax=Geothrix sp. PMB-07 TaxID=3068640 RepID=UPI0027410EF7|nr:tail assembly protein [Geothrix sp. PMB-07]WLT30081.1 tail assembly protein [Geothrix sp. PMB-07]
MKRIRLYGALRSKFGKEFRLNVATPAEAVRALCSMVRGFKEHLQKHSEPGYQIIVGGEARGEQLLEAPMGEELIQIVPVVAGAKDGLTTLVLGAALVYLSAGTGAFSLAGWGASAGMASAVGSLGLAMVMGGAAQMLSSPQDLNTQAGDKGPDDTPTYAFSGPHLTTGQGNPVPVGYGRLRIGGAIVSLGISPETWPDKGFGGKAADNNGNPGGTGDLTPWVWAVGPS